MNKIKLIRQGLILVLILVVDLITKYFLFDIAYLNLIPNFISIASNGGNTGAAWGVLGGHTILLVVTSVIMIAGIIAFDVLYKTNSAWFDVGFALMLGGAIGNLIDRIMFGYVRDFIFLDFFPSFPVFNIADSALCVGSIIIVVSILFKRGNSEK